MKKEGLGSEWILIIIAFAGLIIYRKLNLDKPDTGNENGNPGKGYSQQDENEGVEPTADPDLNTVCQKGSQGTAVKKIQQRMNTIVSFLKSKKSAKFKLDNPAMNKYYLDIAKENGIKADGVFGDKTLHLCKVLTGKSQISLRTARKKYVIWTEQPWIKSGNIVVNPNGGGGLFGTWIHN